MTSLPLLCGNPGLRHHKEPIFLNVIWGRGRADEPSIIGETIWWIKSIYSNC